MPSLHFIPCQCEVYLKASCWHCNCDCLLASASPKARFRNTGSTGGWQQKPAEKLGLSPSQVVSWLLLQPAHPQRLRPQMLMLVFEKVQGGSSLATPAAQAVLLFTGRWSHPASSPAPLCSHLLPVPNTIYLPDSPTHRTLCPVLSCVSEIQRQRHRHSFFDSF